MALRSSSSGSLASLKSKVKSYASSAQSYNDAKMLDDYNNGLISPAQYASYIEQRMGSVAPGTTEYISWSKKLRSTELDRVQAPLEEGVKAGTVLPGDFAEWLRTNRLPDISIDSPKYAQMMNEIQSYDERQVSLEDVFANNQINQLKNIDARAADAAKVEYYASRINRFSNPIKQAEAENTYNQVLTESQKNQVRFAIRDMNRQLASMGSDSSAKAAYKYQQYQELYTYALQNGLYEEADSLSIQMMNAQTAVESAISAESKKNEELTSDLSREWNNHTQAIAATAKSPEDFISRVMNDYVAGYESVDSQGNKVAMPGRAAVLDSLISTEEKRYGANWRAYNKELDAEDMVMAALDPENKAGIDYDVIKKQIEATGVTIPKTLDTVLKLASGKAAIYYNAKGELSSNGELNVKDVEELADPTKYARTGNKFAEKTNKVFYTDKNGNLVAEDTSQDEIKKKYGIKDAVGVVSIGDKQFVSEKNQDGEEVLIQVDKGQNPLDTAKEMRSLAEKQTTGGIAKETFSRNFFENMALGGKDLLSGLKGNIGKKAEEHAAQVRAAEEEKARKAEAERIAAEASKRQVAQQVTQQIKTPTATLAPMATKPVGFQTPVSTAKAAAQKTTTTPISGPGGIDFQTASIITRDAQKLLSDWVGQGKPSFYTEKNIIPALAKQYGRQESEIAPIVYAERKKSKYGGE